MTSITPGSAFAPDYQPKADWTDCGPRKDGMTHKEAAAFHRAKRQEQGETGTICGLSRSSDEAITKYRKGGKKARSV